MLDWDRLFVQLARESNLSFYHYSRYLDDTGNGVKAVPLGMSGVRRKGG